MVFPIPEGEDYQKGEMLGHYNVRQYVHHLESRKTGGDAPDNQGTLCEECHKQLHKGLITGDTLKERRRSDRIYRIRPVRHHNRQLHKATFQKGSIRKANQAPVYVKGFRLFDKVSYLGMECFISGRRSSGYFVLKTLDGKNIHQSASYKKLVLLERSTTNLIA